MTTVLLTGAGGAAIPGLIQKLHQSGYRVLTADMDPYAVGLYLADKGFIIPAGHSSEFLPALGRICFQEKVDAVVPLVDEELLSAITLEKKGVVVILPQREFIATCLDKFQLMHHLREVGIAAPETHLASNGMGNMQFPIVAKPRMGRGSRGVGIINSERDLITFLKNSPYQPEDLLLQKYIEGPEFTVSVVVWRDGNVKAVIPKEIIFKKGITHMAVTRRNEKIETLCKTIQSRLKPNGPFNLQLRIDAETGKPLPFEINPRFSTTVSLTIAAGVDEIGGLIAQAIGHGTGEKFGNFREGLVLLRRTLDVFVEEADFNDRPVIHYTELTKGENR